MTGIDIRWLTVFFDFPADDFGDEVTFWRAIAGSTVSPSRGDKRQFASLEPFHGDPHLRVQRIDDSIGGVHLDLHVDDVDAASSYAESLGASIFYRGDEWVCLRSPAGFTFCIVRWEGQHRRSRPIRWLGDTISIIDQICIDIPTRKFAAECTFWESLTTWTCVTEESPEFRSLRRPDDMAIRILLQRLKSGPVSAHVDLATTHLEDEVARHIDWGAEIVEQHRWWTTMSDPTGRLYCITARSPRTGELPDA